MTQTSAAGPPAVVARLNSRSDGVADFAWQAFLALAANFPERRAARLAGTYAARGRLPSNASVRLAYEADETAIVVAEIADAAMLIRSTPVGTAFSVAARERDLAESVLAHLTGDTEPSQDAGVPVTLWHLAGAGAQAWQRHLAAPRWEDIATNYPRAVRDGLHHLVQLAEPAGPARLLLWTGEAGTGKTSAVRALMQAWQKWASSHLVADPERMFGDASYLLQVMSSEILGQATPRLDRDSQPQQRWNLVVCEDADDFIRADVRQHTGAGLGRLLNTTDGLLGQGLHTLVLLTSNTPWQRLDPALLRPGRCLSRLEFARFERKAAAEWLGLTCHQDIPNGGLTLAELYERAGKVTRLDVTDRTAVSVGAYL